MALQNDTSRIQYNGNNSTTNSYAIPFVFFENSHIKCVVTTSAGVDTELTLGSTFNVTGAGNQNGGSLTTTTAVPTSSKVTIFRNVPATQTTSYQEGGDFPAASHERALDKLTMIAQQTQRLSERALRVSEAGGALQDLTRAPNTILGLDAFQQPKSMTVNEVKSFLALTGVQLNVNAGTKTFADDGERNIATPDFLGQFATQRNNQSIYIAVSMTAGGWSRLLLSNSSIPPTWIRTSSADTSGNNAGGVISAVSWDGVVWQTTTKTPVFPEYSRDASVIFYNNQWVVVYTDAFNSTTKTFGLATSPNLRDWTVRPKPLLTGAATSGTANNVWAPEWFVDGNNYYVIVRLSTTAGNNYGAPGMGYMRCTNPGTWTQWTDWQPFDNTIPTPANDVYIIKRGNIYHLFSHQGDDIVRQTSSSPFQNYSAPVNVTQAARTAGSIYQCEGPSVLQISGDHYRLYFQNIINNHGWVMDSFDGMNTWDLSTLQLLQYIGLDGRGHGTVIKASYTAIGTIQETIRQLATPPQQEPQELEASTLGVIATPQLLLKTVASDTSGTNSGGIKTLVSNDGIDWLAIPSSAEPVEFARDPSAVFYNNAWACVYTREFGGTSKTFGLVTSSNLRSWTNAGPITLTGPATSGTASNVWAPAWYVENGQYHVLVRLSTTAGNSYGAPGVGYTTCTNPGTWTNWTSWQVIGGLATSANDPFLIKRGSVYTMFITEGSHIVIREASSPFTGYGASRSVTSSALDAQAGAGSIWGGASVVQLADDHYRLHLNRVTDNTSWAIDSFDGMQTWPSSSLRRQSFFGRAIDGSGKIVAIPNSTAARTPMFQAMQFALSPFRYVPAAANSFGLSGQMAADSSHLYVCTADNTWRRAALASW